MPYRGDVVDVEQLAVVGVVGSGHDDVVYLFHELERLGVEDGAAALALKLEQQCALPGRRGSDLRCRAGVKGPTLTLSSRYSVGIS
jgi:hypothetical protein